MSCYTTNQRISERESMLTEDDVRLRLRAAIEAAGSQRNFADEHGFTASYIHDVLHGRRALAPRILEALGVERVVRYREIAHDIAHIEEPSEEKREGLSH